MVNVPYGINSACLQLAGKTVDQVRTELAAVLGVPGDAKAILNGQDACGNTALRDEDELEFVKASSVKG